jgi:type IV fimbrial biogenesis protein FimT
MNTTTQRGFTLFELLVTLLVAGVILGIGVPNLLEFSRNNRITATANDLITSLYLARSEAVKRTTPITLCASPEPLLNNPTCDPDVSDPNSEGGYIVWVDADADAVVDAGEQILLQRDDPQDIVVFGDSGYVNFAMNGNIAAVAGAGPPARRILFCDTRGNVIVSGTLSAARAVRIDQTGHASVLNEVATIAPVVTALGAACP